MIESITPRIKSSCFSFIHNTSNKRERLDSRMVTHCNAKSSYNMDKGRTSALTSPRCAALLHVSVGFVDLRLGKGPPLAAISASNRLNRCILRACMPCDASILWRILLRRRHVCRTSNSSTTITKESVHDRHHSSPQHTAHLPLLCFGLHLFLSIPCTRPCSGAT